jgi:hypothetical protein
VNGILSNKADKAALGLDQLAGLIRICVSEIQRACLTALDIAMECGDALNEAQSRVPTGSWIRWLDESCSMARSTAALYQQLANHRDEIEAEMSRYPGLSIRAARALITKTKKIAETESELPAPAPAISIESNQEITDLMREALEATAIALEAIKSADRPRAKAAARKNQALTAFGKLVEIHQLLMRLGHDVRDIEVMLTERMDSPPRRDADGDAVRGAQSERWLG